MGWWYSRGCILADSAREAGEQGEAPPHVVTWFLSWEGFVEMAMDLDLEDLEMGNMGVIALFNKGTRSQKTDGSREDHRESTEGLRAPVEPQNQTKMLGSGLTVWGPGFLFQGHT